MTFVVLDTNVLVSAMISHLDHGHPASLLRRLVRREFVPVYSRAIMEEYEEVLRRKKFGFCSEDVDAVLSMLRLYGMCEERLRGMTGLPLCSEPDDQVFYDLVHSTDSLLITGNTKHFPVENRVCTPAAFDKGDV